MRRVLIAVLVVGLLMLVAGLALWRGFIPSVPASARPTAVESAAKTSIPVPRSLLVGKLRAVLARPSVAAAEQEPSDTATPISSPRADPPPGEELDFYACIAETKHLESLVRVYELLKEQPLPELQEAALNLVEVGRPLEAQSLCTGEDALATYELGRRLCDATDSSPVPEAISTFCGR